MRASILFCIFLLSSLAAFTQTPTVSCGDAVTQLQVYATQVNQIYGNEYWRVIPNQRCPAYNAWGQPFNPQLVQNCRLQMLYNLNQWYGMQCNYVNNWYLQIMRGCSTKEDDLDEENTDKPAPKKRVDSEENDAIDTDEIKDLNVGIDEDKAVKIKIPKTASGFKPQ
jgi:hypothetical protein